MAGTTTPPPSRRAAAAERLRVLVQTMVTLATGSLGFVAALAWNDAISTSVRRALREDNEVVGLYIYAVLATVIAVVLVMALANLAARSGGEASIARAVD